MQPTDLLSHFSELTDPRIDRTKCYPLIEIIFLVISATIVVPLLVYNGTKSPYPYTLDIFELFNDIELAKKTFTKPAYLIDLTQIFDEKIKKHNLIGLLEFCQQH